MSEYRDERARQEATRKRLQERLDQLKAEDKTAGDEESE